MVLFCILNTIISAQNVMCFTKSASPTNVHHLYYKIITKQNQWYPLQKGTP